MANYSNIIVFDLETGGLKLAENPVCEIAMIALDGKTLEELGRYESVIQQFSRRDDIVQEYTQRAFDVNGLSIRKLQNGKPADQVAKETAEFAKEFKSKAKKPILSGHNINSFDIPRLDDYLYQFKIDASKIFHNETIDTLDWAKYKWAGVEEYEKHNLPVCCERANIRLVDAHSAMPDTEANAKLLVSFLKSLRGDGEVTVQEETKTRTTFNF